MTRKFELSRRKLLAGVGAAGVASVGAGLGTSAYFNDTESFTGNELVAGQLDLKVNWTEHYSDWSDDESESIDTVSMSPGDGLTGFPSTAPPSHRMVYVSDADQFMQNTAIEAFPDVLTEDPEAGDYDGSQATLDPDDEICGLPADLDGVLSHPYRTGGNVDGGVTIGDPPNAQTTAPGDPLVSISDVKPGDFGEVTFGFHLCDNPGYVWLTGALDDASENGYTDPELDADAEDGPEGDTVELLDAVRAAVWYDTGEDSIYGADVGDEDAGEGDNVFGPGEVLLPLTGSLRNVLSMLESGMFPLDATPVSTVGDGVVSSSDGSGPSVSGEIEDGDDYVDEVVVTTEDDRFDGNGARNYQCADYAAAFGLEAVGSEILNPDTSPIEEEKSYSGCTTITVDDIDNGTGTITLSSTGSVLVVSVKGGQNGEQVYVFSEPVVLDGATFTTPGDYGISNVDVCCPVGGGGSGSTEDTPSDGNGGRDCFPNSTTAYVGFEWWLPVDVGNEVQGDSVEFDLGFYAEQCRHNDGGGPADGTTTSSS